MKVWFVGAGPGDPELLTVKVDRLLRKARCCIWAGSLVNPEILKILPDSCEVHDSAGMNLDEIIELICRYRDRDINVVRLHTGDPCLYGAVLEQMRRLDDLGIEYEMLPGISAFQAAASALQVELTIPEISQAVVLTRAEGRTPLPEKQKLEHFARTGATLCLYLSAHLIDRVRDALIPYYGAECPAAVCYRVSWPDQDIRQCTVNTLPETMAGIERTALVLVGPSLGKESPESHLYGRAHSHGFRKGLTE